MKNEARTSAATPDQASRRIFSTELKQKIVKEVEAKQITIAQVVRIYQVSRKSVYRWLYQYSLHMKASTQMVVQLNSEATRTEQLRKEVAELERVVGQKQLQIDYFEQLIRISSEELGIDIKKNFDTKCLNTSGNRPRSGEAR